MKELVNWWLAAPRPRALARLIFTNSPIPQFTNLVLPVLVLRSVQRRSVEGRVDVEHVLAAPMGRVWLVLIRTQAPFGAVGHRVDRNVAKKLQFAAGGIVRGSDAIHQRLKIRRIVLVGRLELERADVAEVGLVLVLIDRGAHFTQRAPQLGLAVTPRGDLRQRHDRRGEDQDDRRDDEQFDERVTARLAQVHCSVIVTGVNRRPMATPPGPVAVPLNVNVVAPASTASNRIAASRPVPVAPVTSPARVIVMSMRLPLTCWLKAVVPPPERRKPPSCTVRMRSFSGS